ncbi:MAG: DUF2871 domain-containing protein [Candidatus Ornithomonoglobus sp.]
MKKAINTSVSYAVGAIAAGVFFREFTKFNGFSGATSLGVVHTHLFALGTILFLVLALLCNSLKTLVLNKMYRRFCVLYNIALPFMAVMMLVRGVFQVLGTELSRGADASISGVAGIAHVMMLVSLIFLFIALKQEAKQAE